MSMQLSRRIAAVALMLTAGVGGGALMNTAEAAGSVSVQGGVLTVRGGNEANVFSVQGIGGGKFLVSDGLNTSISAGSGCTKTSATGVSCTGVTNSIRVNAGGGNDGVRLRSTNLTSTIHGDGGNDTLVGSSTAVDFIFGDADNDSLSGSGSDQLNGGAGIDKCSGAFLVSQCES